MTGTTISSAQTTGVRLTTTSQNPVTVTGAGSVIPTTGTYAIYGNASFAWTISNAGTLTDPYMHNSRYTGWFHTCIELMAGGSVGNTGLISSSGIGILMIALGTVTNQGSIAAGNSGYGIGVELGEGGMVTNAAGAMITGIRDDVVIAGAAGTVVNQGSISAVYGGNVGVLLYSGGAVSNAANASIAGSSEAIQIWGVGTVTNHGSIAGVRGGGIALMNGGTVSNAADASITGLLGCVGIQNATGTVDNHGSIGSTSKYVDGVKLGLGGAVSNAATAIIRGVSIYGGAGTVLNHGTISGDVVHGVYLADGGTVSNSAHAFIYEAEIKRAAGTVVNAGTIGSGVELEWGGIVTNAAGALIAGVGVGVRVGVVGAAATVVNAGTISGGVGNVAAGGLVSNDAGASITGELGVFIGDAGTVANAGTITGTGRYGVKFGSGGLISNATSASITAIDDGVFAYRNFGSAATVTNAGTIAATGTAGIGVNLLFFGGTLTNAGTIIGNGGTAAYLGGKGTNLLVIDPGAVFSGIVVSSPHAHTTLEANSGSGTGTLSGLGSSFINFGTVTVDTGARWNLAGTNVLFPGNTLTNHGTLTLLDSNLGGRGGTLGNAGTLEGAAGSSTIVPVIASTGEVLENTGTLEFTSGGSFGGKIAGSGRIDLLGGKAYTFGPGLAISASQLNLISAGASLTLASNVTDAGSFRLGPETVLHTGTFTLTLGGPTTTLVGLADGAGTVTVSGTAIVSGLALSGTTTLLDTKSIMQAGSLMLGTASTDKAGLRIEAGATYALGNGSIVLDGTGSIANAGLFEKTTGTGDSEIAPMLANMGTVAVLRGTLEFLGGVANSGSIVTEAGTLFLDGGISGSGTTAIGTSGVVKLTGAATGAQTFDFTAAKATLDLATPRSFAAIIADFAKGDTIDLLATPVTKIVYQGQSLTVENGASPVAVLHFSGSYAQSDFTTAPDKLGGTLILHT